MAEKSNHDSELCERLITRRGVGSRIVAPSPGYFKAFSKPNYHLKDSRITHIAETAAPTADGKSFDCEVLYLPSCLGHQFHRADQTSFMPLDSISRIFCVIWGRVQSESPINGQTSLSRIYPWQLPDSPITSS